MKTEVIERVKGNGKGNGKVVLPETDEGGGIVIPSKPYQIIRPDLAKTFFNIESIPGSPLHVCRLGEDALDNIENTLSGGKNVRKFLVKEEAWRQAVYLDEQGRECLPGGAFKSCLVNSVLKNKTTNVTKKELKGAIVMPQFVVPLDFKAADRKNIRVGVRNKVGNVNLSYRVQYAKWRCKLEVHFLSQIVSLEVLGNQIDFSGTMIGVGCWRPEKGGNCGRFRVVR